MNPYETEKLLGEYLLFHYASPEDVQGVLPVPRTYLDFPQRTVWEMLPPVPASPLVRALDLGCAVGRSTFTLSQIAQEVIGIDFSQSFIAAAQALQGGDELSYQKLEEGHISSTLVARRPKNCHPDRVTFEHGDAQALRQDLGRFDLVHAANLLCRLPNPAALLHQLPSLVNPGGWLIITTPCTWLAEYTPPDHWPQGSTMDWLTACLEPKFVLHKQADLPFLIRETARKVQWTTALATLWQRKM